MPKFLDQPSWYASNGTQVYGVGTSKSTSHTDGAVPVWRQAAGYFDEIVPTLNGHSFTDISVWYAPPNKPVTYDSICHMTPQDTYPSWLGVASNYPAVLAYSASAEKIQWLSGTSSGRVLTVGYNGALEWRLPTFTENTISFPSLTSASITYNDNVYIVGSTVGKLHVVHGSGTMGANDIEFYTAPMFLPNSISSVNSTNLLSSAISTVSWTVASGSIYMSGKRSVITHISSSGISYLTPDMTN